MDIWESWTLSSESENRLNEVCAKLNSTNSSEISKVWQDLFNYGSPPIPNCSFKEMELDLNEENPREEEILNLIKESIETNVILPEETLIGISYNSLNRILLSVSNSLKEEEFSIFCKFIASWNNTALVEESLKFVVLPKLKDKTEASACMIFSIKELAISKPDKLCQTILIPLLTDESFNFNDVELLSGVFSALPPAQKDLLILTMTKKKDFQESDWLLLQPLVNDLSPNSTANITNCISKFSHKFPKSQVFGRFLVNFCKNLNFISNKDLLLEAIGKHQTLLKRQALKYLESM